MSFCTACGTKVSIQTRFCPSCGQAVNVTCKDAHPLPVRQAEDDVYKEEVSEITALMRSFDFSGRATRREFWMHFALQCVLAIAILLRIHGGTEKDGELLVVFLLGQGVVFLLSNISVCVRRLHDAGCSGALALLLFVPFVNVIAYLVWGFLPQAKRNEYGNPVRAYSEYFPFSLLWYGFVMFVVCVISGFVLGRLLGLETSWTS